MADLLHAYTGLPQLKLGTLAAIKQDKAVSNCDNMCGRIPVARRNSSPRAKYGNSKSHPSKSNQLSIELPTALAVGIKQALTHGFSRRNKDNLPKALAFG